MTNTETHTSLPVGYATKAMKSGLKVRQIGGNWATILKGEKATESEAIRQAWGNKTNVEEMIAIRAAQAAQDR